MKSTTRNTLAFIVIGIIIFLFPSCKTLDISGNQEVEMIYSKNKKQTVLKLKGLKSTFVFPSDTLKVRDIVNLKKRTK